MHQGTLDHGDDKLSVRVHPFQKSLYGSTHFLPAGPWVTGRRDRGGVHEGCDWLGRGFREVFSDGGHLTTRDPQTRKVVRSGDGGLHFWGRGRRKPE